MRTGARGKVLIYALAPVKLRAVSSMPPIFTTRLDLP